MGFPFANNSNNPNDANSVNTTPGQLNQWRQDQLNPPTLNPTPINTEGGRKNNPANYNGRV